MKTRIKQGRLKVTREQRVTWFRLPRRMHLAYGALALGLIYLVANPVVMSLMGQALTEGNVSKLNDAAKVSSHSIVSTLKNVVHVSRPPVNSQIPTFHLHLPDNTLQKMQTALRTGDAELNHDPGGIKPYFKAILQTDGVPQRVKVCLRGTMHWHHRTGKPSFRVKVKKDDVLIGDRYIELTTPEDSLVLNNWLPMKLASDLDLMNDASRHVRLFINKKYFGVYVQSNRPGEPFALANGRMPGTFFKAEFSEQMWESASAWKTFGQEDPQDIAVMQQWLEILASQPTPANIEAFRNLFDTEKFARWAALMTVVGSIHTDDRHNHSYFFCSNQGKLEPMPWDCNGYGLHTQPDSPVDVQVQPVLRFLASDPRWVHRRNQWIQTLIEESGSLEQTTQTIERCLSEMRDDLDADRHLGDLKKFTGTGWNWVPTSVADIDQKRSEILNWIKARNEYLNRYLTHAKFSVETNQAESQINVFGTVAVEMKNRVTGETRILYPGISKKRWVHTSHQQQADIQFLYLRPASQSYRLVAPLDQIEFRNAITGQIITPENNPEDPATQSALARESRSLHIDDFPQPKRDHIELGPGLVQMDRDLIISDTQSLTVAAGTQIKLASGVGIYSEGKTEFLGTEQQPIQISGSGTEPWAAIGITGPNTANTILRHVEVSGGSTGQLKQLRFKGMLNVYNCPQVTMSHCKIGINYVGDDAVNLAESKITVDNCRWDDAKADALDLDMCSGTVSNCQWFNSGNDGLDLMSCTITVRDCEISGSGDKGISVGENTRLQATGISIRGCLIGTEIKDDSVARYTQSEFENCRTAVRSYQKKWFYSAGGTCALVDCTVKNSHDADVEMKPGCQAVLVRTSTNKPTARAGKSKKRVQHLDELPSEWNTLIKPLPFPQKREAN